MEFDGQVLIAKEFVEHLGNIIHIRSRQSVEKVIGIFNTKVNALISNFCFAPTDVKYRYCLLRTVCPCTGHSSGIMTRWNVSDSL